MAYGSDSARPRVAIVGGGLAGMAAAVALAPRSCEVHLFESRRKLGGRAGSYVDRISGESIDHCQHVAMGCCTNFLDFCRTTRIDDFFSRHRTLHFFGPDGRRSDFSPSRWLPAPLHLAGALFSLRFLSFIEKLSIVRAIIALIRTPADDRADGPTVLAWLDGQRQSAAVIESFWTPVLVSSLAESLDRASLAAARKVFVDGFASNVNAVDILIPAASLDELYDRHIGSWLVRQGVHVHRQTPIVQIKQAEGQANSIALEDGSIVHFDFVVVAVPWMRAKSLVEPEFPLARDAADKWSAIASSPISSLHLWFHQPITELPHAILVGRLSQWLFARPANIAAGEYCYQVVISASHELIKRERQGVVDEVLNELRAVFPRSQTARLLRWQLITDQNAVFSMRPGIDAVRPPQRTVIPNLLLAGDWTRTGWPATMEGAVRSGYLAAEAVLKEVGRAEAIVVPDLPRNWITRRF